MLFSTKSIQDLDCHEANVQRAYHAPRHGQKSRGLLRGLLYASAFSILTGCYDSSYDVTDVDATIGVGADGLKVKLGNTEKIYLKDIIDTDGNTKTDASNQFYLTEQGSTEINYSIQPVNSTVDKLATVNTTFQVLRWGEDLRRQFDLPESVTEITVPENYTLHGYAEGENKADFSTANIGKEVKRISRVYPRNFGASLIVNMKTSKNVSLRLDRLENFAVTLPQYVYLREVPKGWTLDQNTLTHQGDINFTSSSQEICTVDIDYIDLKEQGTPVNGKITLDKSMTRAAMSGTAFFSSKSKFTMREGDYADIELNIQFFNDGQIVVDSIRGLFDPTINPEVTPIDISSNLPDFLKDEATKIKVSNPTLKFDVDMKALPTSVSVGAALTSVKDGQSGWSQQVTLPQTVMQGGRDNIAYYHRNGDRPYDPESEIAADAIVQRVSDLGNLIERLPDRIEVNMRDGKVALLQQEATLGLGRTYRARANYSVFVPLEVEEGFTIIYKDSTESLGDDLEDYTAEGVQLKTMAENTIPLGLTLSIEACDQSNRVIPGITFTQAQAQAGQGAEKAPVKSEMTMEGTLKNPKDLQLIDHFLFVIKAESTQESPAQPLSSQQYIRLTDIRLRLKGRVTADLN